MASATRKFENTALVIGAYIVMGVGFGVIAWQHISATTIVAQELANTMQIQDRYVAGVVGFFQFERFLSSVAVVIAGGVGGIVGIRAGDVDVAAVGCALGHPIMLLTSGVVVSFMVSNIPGLGRPTPVVFIQPIGVELVAVSGVAGVVGGAVAVSVVVLQP